MEETEPQIQASASERTWHVTTRALKGHARWLLPVALLVAATVLFRVPTLLNAAAVNSDMAVVGLQAMHILQGEWSWNLWGAAYQAPIDSLIAAALFALIGHSAFALALVPVLDHVAIVVLTYAVLRARLARWHAVIPTLTVVFTPMAVNLTLIVLQRQACFLQFVLSVWLLHGAAGHRWSLFRYAFGAWCAFLSVYFDLYAMQWLPALLVFAVLCAFDQRPRLAAVASRLGSIVAGTFVGYGTFTLLRNLGNTSSGQLRFAWDRLEHNFGLLWDRCLPWALGYRVFYNNGAAVTMEWTPPDWFHTLQVTAALLVAVGMVFAYLGRWWTRIPWELRRLGMLGVLVAASSIGAFLVSVMPSDWWSTRYLAPIVLAMPFGLAPVAYWLGKGRSAIAFAPYLLSATVGGWMSYGLEYRQGALPLRTSVGEATEERMLARFLRDRGIEVGVAQYWIAYRLTFLFGERPIVVPGLGDDRYPPYRRVLARAHDVAYIVHPSMPWISAADQERELVARAARFERDQVERYTVFIEHR